MSASAESLGRMPRPYTRKGVARGEWSAREIADLLRLLKTTDLNYSELAPKLGHSAKAIQNKVGYLRRTGVAIPDRRDQWSEAERAELIRLRREALPDSEIAVRLNRGISTIKSQLIQLRGQGMVFPSRAKKPPVMDTEQRKAIAKKRAAARIEARTAPPSRDRFARGIVPEEKAAPVEIITRICKGAHCNGNVFQTDSRFIYRCKSCRERRE